MRRRDSSVRRKDRGCCRKVRPYVPVILYHFPSGRHRRSETAGSFCSGTSSASRAAAAANNGNGSSRSALIAHSASASRGRARGGTHRLRSTRQERRPGCRRDATDRRLTGRLALPAGYQPAASALPRPLTIRRTSRTAKHPFPIGLSVQSQRLALMQTGRTSTPCCSASRTICDGA